MFQRLKLRFFRSDDVVAEATTYKHTRVLRQTPAIWISRWRTAPRREESAAAARNVSYRTELVMSARGGKIFGSLHIFLASKVNIRILHDANSLQKRG
jgi:hypothetical protein